MYTVEPIEPPLTDETVCDINAFENGLAAELDPAMPPLPASATRAYAELHDPNDIATAYLARAAEGGVVGTAWIFAPKADNQHMTFMRLGVAAAHRRRGVATALFAKFVEFAAVNERTSLVLGADLHHPAGDAFAASLGANLAMRSHVNQLVLSDVPDGLVEHWLATAHSATGAVHEYELAWVPDSDVSRGVARRSRGRE